MSLLPSATAIAIRNAALLKTNDDLANDDIINLLSISISSVAAAKDSQTIIDTNKVAISMNQKYSNLTITTTYDLTDAYKNTLMTTILAAGYTVSLPNPFNIIYVSW